MGSFCRSRTGMQENMLFILWMGIYNQVWVLLYIIYFISHIPCIILLYSHDIQIQKPNIKKLMHNTLLLLWLLLTIASPANYIRQTCTSDQIFDTTTLGCKTCPTTMRPNPKQPMPTSCICKKGYYPISINQCAYLSTNTSACALDQYFGAVGDDGLYTGGALYTCTACDGKAFANNNGTGCTPCPRNMKYSLAQRICTCETGFETLQGCFTNEQMASTSMLTTSSSKYYNNLKYLLPSCAYFQDMRSCSELVNLCTYSMGYADAMGQAQCQFFTTLTQYQNYLKLDTTTAGNSFYISPGKFSKNQQISIKLLYYLPTGNFVKQKQMKLPDILRCGMPADNSITIKLGNNIQVSCSFDFDYLVGLIQTNTYESYVYEAFVAGQGGQYFPIAVYIGSSGVALRRFFLEDTYTNPTYVNVLNGLKLSFSLNSTGYLVSPQLRLSYKKLSIQGSKITPTIDRTQIITYQVKFVYDLKTFWTPFIAIFITINILVLIQSIIRTYIGHLNKQSVLNFFFHLANFWSLWMFYFLIVISGYWFFFCKTTQDVYIFIPDSASDVFYVAFFIIAGIMGLFRLITVFLDKKDKLNYQIFLINWQKGRNSWRQIFIVNSLAEFYTHRTISFFWMLLCVMFFLVGLKWENHAAEVAHTTLSTVYYFNPINRVFLYFLGATIFLVIGIVFKILRRISVFKWPYPFENFVDYCNIANVSLFFMKKRSQQAFYIHASIPHRVEVSYREINNAIRVGLTKQRGLLKEYSFHGGQHMYIVYICKDLEQKFNNMIKRSQEDQHEQLTRHTQKNIEKKKKSKSINPRQDFIENKLKPYLDQIGRQGSRRQRTLIRRLFGIPEVDFRDPGVLRTKNTVMNDENMDLVSEIFPNGNQFEQIHTVIIIFLMFLLITANVCASALITYFVSEYIMDKLISVTCRSRLEKMTKVKEGFML